MRTKLLLVLMVLTMSSTILAQNVGDYQTAGAGPANWHTAASWEVWDGVQWIPATNYPGQINGTYDVKILTGHVITLTSDINNLPNTFDTLTIDGEIQIFNNQNVYINATTTIVTVDIGKINFIANANLYFPANMQFSVFPGGLYPPDESNGCNASKRIYIGTILFSSCNGNGPGDPISFWELMQANGNLVSVVTTAFSDCNAATFNATLTPSFLGLEGQDTTFSWKIKYPNGSIVEYYNAPLILDLNMEGDYQFDLTYKTYYEGQLYSNTRTIVYANNLTRWFNSAWTRGVPTIDTRVIIDDDYNGDSFSACFLLITEGNTLSINSDKFVEVAGGVLNNGNIVITENGSLVQIDNLATFTGTSISTSTVTRESRGMKRLDYVYWGSPVSEPLTLTTAPTTDYFDRFYTWNITGAQTGIWSAISTTPAPGNGFIARVKPSHVSPNTTQMVFGGTSGSKLNSGPITVNANVYNGGDPETHSGNSVLLANPYPSAISANSLLNSYSQIVKLLFWTSVTVYTGTGQYQFADYAAYNLSGGTEPGSASGNLALRPQGYIASGQGFFAQVNSDVNIVFNNSMRVRENNTQFFRMADADAVETAAETEKHRLWINLNNGKDAYRQMLVGYIEGASNGFDNQYDATSFTTNEIDIYTVLQNKELAIQGRGLPFNDADIIPVGYRVTNAGNYFITLSETDGLFTEYKEVYIKDKTTNTFHNLKKGSYEFHAQTGTFNDRFEIHFKEQSKENNEIVSENNILIYGANGALNVNSYETNIQTIEVYDLLGKLIYTANEINGNQFVSTTIKTANPFLIARVTLTNNQVITKKIIIN